MSTKNSEQVLVSVIILNYNGEKFLKNCLDSILKETNYDFELIVVDNNSPDHSGEKFSNKYAIKNGANMYIENIYLISLCGIREKMINVDKVIQVKTLLGFLIQKYINPAKKNKLNIGASCLIISKK